MLFIKCPQYLNKALGVQQCAGRCVAKMRKCERKEGEKNWVSANKLTQFLKMHKFHKN